MTRSSFSSLKKKRWKTGIDALGDWESQVVYGREVTHDAIPSVGVVSPQCRSAWRELFRRPRDLDPESSALLGPVLQSNFSPLRAKLVERPVSRKFSKFTKAGGAPPAHFGSDLEVVWIRFAYNPLLDFLMIGGPVLTVPQLRRLHAACGISILSLLAYKLCSESVRFVSSGAS